MNEYTRALDEQAVHKMLEWAEREGLFRAPNPRSPCSPDYLRICGHGALRRWRRLCAQCAGCRPCLRVGAVYCVQRGAGAETPCMTRAR